MPLTVDEVSCVFFFVVVVVVVVVVTSSLDTCLVSCVASTEVFYCSETPDCVNRKGFAGMLQEVGGEMRLVHFRCI